MAVGRSDAGAAGGTTAAPGSHAARPARRRRRPRCGTAGSRCRSAPGRAASSVAARPRRHAVGVAGFDLDAHRVLAVAAARRRGQIAPARARRCPAAAAATPAGCRTSGLAVAGSLLRLLVHVAHRRARSRRARPRRRAAPRRAGTGVAFMRGTSAATERPQAVEQARRGVAIERRIVAAQAEEEAIARRQIEVGRVEERVVQVRQAVADEQREHRRQRAAENRQLERRPARTSASCAAGRPPTLIGSRPPPMYHCMK